MVQYVPRSLIFRFTRCRLQGRRLALFRRKNTGDRGPSYNGVWLCHIYYVMQGANYETISSY